MCSQAAAFLCAKYLNYFYIIYSSPTPTLEWRRVDKDLPEKVYPDGNGLSLTIPNVNYDDAGTYECSARNVNGGVPVRKTIKLEVECKC